VANEWDAAASVYEDQFEQVTSTTVDRLIEWLAPRDGTTFADVACGPGTVTMHLAERGAAVRASDFSPEMVKRATQRAAERGFADRVTVEAADAASLPLDDASVDGAVSNFGVIFCPDIDAALAELARVTRAGGRLAITAWTTEGANGWTTLLADDYESELGFAIPPRPMYRWSTADELQAALARAGWSDVTVDTIDFTPKLYSPDDLSEVITTPATRLALATLSDAQVAALVAYLERRANARTGGEPIALPRQAWLATGMSGR
jgi:ubiquinone/menaquinone biosynthesis C-methylase UbiE